MSYNVNFNLHLEAWSVDNIWWAKFELECLLLIFIYSNSKFKVTFKKRTLNAGNQNSYQRKTSKFTNITLAILPFSQKNTLTKSPSLVLWSLLLLIKHQMCFKMQKQLNKPVLSQFYLILSFSTLAANPAYTSALPLMICMFL